MVLGLGLDYFLYCPREPLVYSQVLAEIPNIVHGFTSAQGGNSSGDFQSLNLSLRVGDDRSSVLKNVAPVLGWPLETAI